MEPLIAAGGWCTPTEQLYDLNTPSRPLPEASCPPWDGLTADACKSHSVWLGEIGWKSWHDCEYEFNGPHDVCKCTDCGAERVVLRETP